MSDIVNLPPGELRGTITVTRKDGTVETFTLTGRIPVDHSATGALEGQGAELSTEEGHGSDPLDRSS